MKALSHAKILVLVLLTLPLCVGCNTLGKKAPGGDQPINNAGPKPVGPKPKPKPKPKPVARKLGLLQYCKECRTFHPEAKIRERHPDPDRSARHGDSVARSQRRGWVESGKTSQSGNRLYQVYQYQDRLTSDGASTSKARDHGLSTIRAFTRYPDPTPRLSSTPGWSYSHRTLQHHAKWTWDFASSFCAY